MDEDIKKREEEWNREKEVKREKDEEEWNKKREKERKEMEAERKKEQEEQKRKLANMVATPQQQRALAEKVEKLRQVLQRAHKNRDEELRRAKHKQEWADKEKEKEGDLKQTEDQIKQAQMLLKSLVERAERAANVDGTKGGKEKRPKP